VSIAISVLYKTFAVKVKWYHTVMQLKFIKTGSQVAIKNR